MMESRGKSWKREREERGRKQAIQQDGNGKNDPSEIHSGTGLPVETDKKTDKFDPKISVTESGEKTQEQVPEEKETIDTTSEEQRQELQQYIKELTEKLRIKAELRAVNTNAESTRPEESFFSKLDSSLKKNTAFIKRLRNMTEMQRDSLIKDMEGLNLTKYISEAAAAIVDAKLKMSDVSTAVQVCSLLHRRYADFSAQLLEYWQKVLPMKKDEKISNPSKIRVDLRFYAELVSSGIFPLKEGLPLLGNLLTVLTGSDREEHSNVGIVLSFCRHCGEDYTGIVPRKYRLLSEKYQMELPKSDFLEKQEIVSKKEGNVKLMVESEDEDFCSFQQEMEAAKMEEFLLPDRQKGLRNLLKDYFKSLCRHVVKDYKALENMEKQNHRILQTKGELSADRKEKFEAAQAVFQKLLSNTEQFSDIVDEDMPHLPKDENFPQDSETTTLDVHNRFKDREMLDGSLSVWEDDDTRSFYENLPDLKAFIPGILFKDSSQAVPQSQTEAVEKLEEDLSQLEIEESELLEAESKEEVKESAKTDDKDLTETLMQEMDETEEEAAASNTANKVLLDHFLNSLLNCVNREMIDQAAVDFCMNLNTRPNRKKLVKALFLVPRTRLDLLPFYSRFVATLNPCMPDVASDLVSMLKQDFKFHIKKKDQINIESKVKTVRFIGELVKFKVFPKTEALYCLKLLLCDFIHHHVEMACNLLETCGRFLFQAPDSHQRIKVLLEQMMRKKAVLSIDSRYTTMIENAFYYCNPPEVAPTVKVERPPMHEYIRKLLYQDLAKTNNDKTSEKQSSSARVLRQMRKLHWEDEETAAYITKCLIAVWNVKYFNIRCLANLLAGLVAYQENVGSQVVDGVLEDIRFGLEINHPKYNQRRIAMVRYLGELYNYRMVESTVIFRVLYIFILYGVNYDGTYSELDPPDCLFRIRLVTTLLDTCGQYFNSGSSKRKLDYFLIFFQRYYWHKRSADIYNDEYPFPVQVRFSIEDTIANLRPKLKLYENLEEAEKAVMDALEELKPKYVEMYPELVNEEMDKKKAQQPVGDDDSLCPIEEEDEEFEDDAQSETSLQDGETEGDTDGYSGSQSQPFEDDGEGGGRHGTSLSDADNDPVYDGEAPVVKSSAQPAHCPEDDDFMAAFDKMLSDSILHRNQESVKPQVDIVIPMNIKGSAIKKTPKFVPPTISSTSTPEAKEPEKPTVNFVLMTRRGNKQQFKNLAVPVTSELAQNLKDREEAERMEKQHVKLLTLNINERQEEEDYQEMLASQQRPSVMNLNRDRRQKYHHPKGAPDVDLIFGNK